MASPLSVDQVEHFFDKVKSFPAKAELIGIIKNGVPVKRQPRTSTQQEQRSMEITAPPC